jgi:AraC family transcriptional regulator
MSEIDKILSHKAFLNREYTVNHLPYEREMEFYQSIKSGNLEEVKRLFMPLGGSGFGVLSENKLRNLKYHLIISVAFITRYCIEGGMEMETAYNISDIYIMKIDKCETCGEIDKIHRELITDFTTRMQAGAKNNLFSKPIIMCFDYIYDHLHEKIHLEQLAELVSLSVQYLSQLFHREVGITISQYINKKRVEAAENMLKFSEYSCSNIANYLHFSSHSHFIQVFKKHTGITPREYRENNFRNKWGSR